MRNLTPALDRRRQFTRMALFLMLLFLSLLWSGCGQSLPFLVHEPVSSISSLTATKSMATFFGKTALPSSTIMPPIKSSATLSPSPTITIGVKEEELKGQIINFWHPWSGPVKREVEKLVEEFNLKNPWGIIVTAVSFPGYDQLALEIETNHEADKSPRVAAGLLHQALIWDQTRPLVNIQTYLFDKEWGFKPQEQTSFYPIFWDQNVINGRRLGVPAFQTSQVLFYNQTWAQELGFQAAPSSTEQFRQQACAAAQANQNDDDPDNNGTGGLIVSTEPGVILGWMEAFGGIPTINIGGGFRPVNNKVTITSQPAAARSVYQFNTPETEAALVFLRTLYDDGCAWQSQYQTAAEPFAHRFGLFATGSVTDLPYQTKAFTSIGAQDQWTVIPYPSPSSADRAIVTSGPSYFLFPGNPQQQLAGWLFIRWLSAGDKNARLVEASGGLPIRSDAVTYLTQFKNRNPQWSAAIELIPNAKSEPAYASWGKVRRALGDAAIQLYRSYFTVDQIPALLVYLDTFSSELHFGPDFKANSTTPTPTRP